MRFMIVFVFLLFTNCLVAQTTLRFYSDEWYAGRARRGKEIRCTVNGNLVCSGVIAPSITLYEPSSSIAKHIGVLICPGGGYQQLMVEKEGFRIAKSLVDAGYTALVLKYSLPVYNPVDGSPFDPVNDAFVALDYLKMKGDSLGLKLRKIGVMGFSAGGHVASSLATGKGACHFDKNIVNKIRPDFQILIYPVISFQPDIAHTGSTKSLLGKSQNAAFIKYFSNEKCLDEFTPIALLLHAEDDDKVAIVHSERYHNALRAAGIASTFIRYKIGGHGFAKVPAFNVWLGECIRWLNDKILP